MIEWRSTQMEGYTFHTVLTRNAIMAASVSGSDQTWYATVIRNPNSMGGESEYLPLRKTFTTADEARQWCERMLNEYGVI